MNDKQIRLTAIEFAKRNKHRIGKELTDPNLYTPVDIPFSIFMAGSPGAGKTEFSKSFISWYEEKMNCRMIRIDSDDIRPLIPGYNGRNSYLFQGAVSLIVEKIHDYALRQKQSFILDGTFSNCAKATENVKRSLKRNRPVFIFYLFQEPEIAWKFTEAREKREGRNIPKSVFVDQFLGSKESVDRIVGSFREKVTIYLVKKDFRRNMVESIIKLNWPDRKIDDYIRWGYARNELENEL